MKLYYRRKGTYADGRMKIVLESKAKKRTTSRTLPLPEVMWEILGHPKNNTISKENKDT